MNSFFVRIVLLFAAVFGVLFVLVWFYLSATSAAQAGEVLNPARGESVIFSTAQLRIVTQTGQSHVFEVELALMPAQHRRGLMFRKHLEAGHGMLFDYNPPRPIAMWMKNTFISLDMLFFDASGRITKIAARTEPFSQDLIVAPGSTRYVLEIPAGTAKSLGLTVGDKMMMR